MIDKIIASGKLNSEKGLNLNNLKLEFKSTVGTGRIFRSYLKNLTIEITFVDSIPKEITIFGSPLKFAYGHNVNNFTQEDLRHSITCISNEIGIDYSELNIQSIEVGANFIVNHSPILYNQALVSHSISSMKRSMIRDFETVKFANTETKEIIFYDKGLEVKYSVPEYLEDLNVLRIEYKLKKRVQETLKQFLKVKDLLKKEIWNDLLTRWYVSYHQVKKISTINWNGKLVFSRLKKFLALKGINHIGPSKVSGMITSISEKQGLSPMQKWRVLDEVKNLLNDPLLISQSDLIKELDHKVNRTFVSHLIH